VKGARQLHQVPQSSFHHQPILTGRFAKIERTAVERENTLPWILSAGRACWIRVRPRLQQSYASPSSLVINRLIVAIERKFMGVISLVGSSTSNSSSTRRTSLTKSNEFNPTSTK